MKDVRTTNKSELKVLEASKTLFWKFGIRKVTVEEICNESGISKMTFYRNFNNKTSVVEAIIKGLFIDGMNAYDLIMSSDASFPDKIEQVFEMKKKNAHDMSEMFVHDLMHLDDQDLIGLMMNFQKESTERLINDLKDAQSEGWIRDSVNIDFVNYMINLIQAQLKSDQFLHIFKSIEDANDQVKNFLFYGMINNKKKK